MDNKTENNNVKPESSNVKTETSNVKAKEKKEKKKIVDFDKIDITTATDDDIIKSGIKKNVKSDYICYGIMAVILILALLPPALWIFNPKPITEEDREIVYVEMRCRRTIQRDGYELLTEMVSNYRAEYVTDVSINFSHLKISQSAQPDYVFAEVNELKSLNYPEIEMSEEENKTSFKIDFNKSYDKLVKDEVLKDYSYVPVVEKRFLTELGFYCSSESRTEVERVDVETGKQIVK